MSRTSNLWVSHHGAALVVALRLAETNHTNLKCDKLLLRWNNVHPLGKVDPATLAKQCTSLRISDIRASTTSIHVRLGIVDLDGSGNPTCTFDSWNVSCSPGPYKWVRDGCMRIAQRLGDESCWVMDHSHTILAALGQAEKSALDTIARKDYVFVCARLADSTRRDYTHPRQPTATEVDATWDMIPNGLSPIAHPFQPNSKGHYVDPGLSNDKAGKWGD